MHTYIYILRIHIKYTTHCGRSAGRGGNDD